LGELVEKRVLKEIQDDLLRDTRPFPRPGKSDGKVPPPPQITTDLVTLNASWVFGMGAGFSLVLLVDDLGNKAVILVPSGRVGFQVDGSVSGSHYFGSVKNYINGMGLDVAGSIGPFGGQIGLTGGKLQLGLGVGIGIGASGGAGESQILWKNW
jgi:hypothetical protein